MVYFQSGETREYGCFYLLPDSKCTVPYIFIIGTSSLFPWYCNGNCTPVTIKLKNEQLDFFPGVFTDIMDAITFPYIYIPLTIY